MSAMKLTSEQQAIFDGGKGEEMAKVMKTLVKYGEIFGATRMEPVTGTYGHLVTSFGMSVMKPIYSLMDELLDGGVVSAQKFSIDPLPLDKNVPANLLQKLFFKVMYSPQEKYEQQLKRMGHLDTSASTCTCYMDEVGNKPKKGDVLSWAESSAVVYANSVLGARCNRNSGIIEMFGSIVGCVPYFGLLTDEGRRASWIVEIKTDKLPEAQILGSAIGMKVVEDVPYIKGLDKFLGTELSDSVCTYLKDFGAATASNGAVGLYHIENLTPEAVEQGEELISDNARVYVIDDAELERVKRSYPVMWKNPNAKPKLCFVGCPHFSLEQLRQWTLNVEEGLKKNSLKKVSIPTVFTTSPAVRAAFEKTELAPRLKAVGVVLSSICPLMYMSNPLCAEMPVITCSNKLRTYTNCRYYTEDEILEQITGGAR